MKTTCSFCRRWAGCAILSGCLSMIGVAVAGGAVSDAAKEAGGGAKKQETKRVAKMVDNLANRNTPPKIVNRRAGRPRKVPLFPKDYDWKEEKRVNKAIHDLYQDPTVELWEELVRRVNDPRYCETTWDSGGEVVIHSVGNICGGLAYLRLCDVFEKHLPSVPPHGCPIYLRDVMKDLPAWRKERKDKSLYQLQIEVCEMAIRELAKVKRLSDEEKADARKDIGNEIIKMKRTKKPIFLESSGHGVGYTSGLAKQIREAVESGSAEDIILEK